MRPVDAPQTTDTADFRDSLANQLLVALPALGDPTFARSATSNWFARDAADTVESVALGVSTTAI